MVLKLHQCLEATTISSASSEENCNSCSSTKKDDCCKTVFKVLKTSEAQKAHLLEIDFLKVQGIVPNAALSDNFSKSLSTNYTAVCITAPPEIQKIALFLKHCNFRI